MKSKSLPIILAALVCSALLIAEEQRIGALQKTVEQLHLDATAAQAQIDKQSADLKKLGERNEMLVAEAEQLRGHLAEAKTGTPEAATAAAGESAGAAANGAGAAKAGGQGDWMKGIAKMFKDPEMKKMMRTQQSMGMRMMYGDLAKELGLSPAEADQVMELLADRQMTASEKAMRAVDDTEKDPAKIAEYNKEAQDAVTAADAKLKALLGDEKMAKFTAYERTIGDRMAMQQYTASFTAAGQPLDDSQRAGLLQIMQEERMKAPPGPLDPGSKDVAASMQALQDGTAMEQALQSQRDLQQRVFARAHTVLTPDQMTAFEAAQKAQLQMQEMGIKMSKQMFGGSDKK